MFPLCLLNFNPSGNVAGEIEKERVGSEMVLRVMAFTFTACPGTNLTTDLLIENANSLVNALAAELLLAASCATMEKVCGLAGIA